eukprot:NODE_3322_length_912_cov_49.940127_g3300_i0.p1 GENE.NODE_3322_length_912_cov_49.940127_g3300_i0~~NODE_3322_length_912_cov_49.940127_g3300_i0.p1  ORF type:complete len:256 (-),score=15.77 NODE_3322_length_912_cov_49.940127_g3300_i0:59-826(-)
MPPHAVDIKFQCDQKLRESAFDRRAGGLIKKAMELAIMCDVKVSLLVETTDRKKIEMHSHGKDECESLQGQVPRFAAPLHCYDWNNKQTWKQLKLQNNNIPPCVGEWPPSLAAGAPPTDDTRGLDALSAAAAGLDNHQSCCTEPPAKRRRMNSPPRSTAQPVLPHVAPCSQPALPTVPVGGGMQVPDLVGPPIQKSPQPPLPLPTPISMSPGAGLSPPPGLTPPGLTPGATDAITPGGFLITPVTGNLTGTFNSP